MANFTGQLRPNEIFGALYNMIISQEVFSDNVKGTYSSLVDKARVDGGLYGDTKLFYATDCLESVEWLDDEEAINLLQLHRPDAPKCQAIYVDVFRQIRLTVDNYLSKRAWSTESAFSSFNSVMLGWIRTTKKIYDSTLYNCYIGTAESEIGKQKMEITPVAGQNDALTMAEALATLLVNLKDVSRDYNDYGFLRSYDEGDLMVVWNAKQYNALKKIDMPVIFHNEGLLNEFDQEVLPSKYFGTLVGDTAKDFTIPAEGVQTYRTLVEINVDGIHLFPGEEIPEGLVVKENETYMEDDSIAFKVMHKRSVPYMSAFEVGTSFFNPRSLTETHYLTFGHNTLEYLENYPMITARFSE
jgi:hypothetical protein